MGGCVKLFVFGLGYTASHFARRHAGPAASIAGTVRSAEGLKRFGGEPIEALLFDGPAIDPEIPARLAASDAVLVSVQPGRGPDPVLDRFGPDLAAADQLGCVVYLSTIGVYGDHGGDWIDETAATEPFNARQTARIQAEQDWLDFGRRTGKQVVILRLAGIYGPGRNALDDLRTGEARRIDKPGQVFNRIHVDDIGTAIAAAIRYRGEAALINVTDDEPAPAPDVVTYAAGLMAVAPPPLITFAEAELSPMARSFYGANRRVVNRRLKAELGVGLAYPTYRDGLTALWTAGEGRS